MRYEVVQACGWGDRSWAAGDEIADGEVPAAVVEVLLGRKAIEPAKGG